MKGKRSVVAPPSRRRAGTPRSIADEIVAGMREALAFARGDRAGAQFRPAPLSARHADAAPAPELSGRDIASIRKQLGVSQVVFARLLNVSASTARSWEQGINQPGGAASRLLQVARLDPQVLLKFVRRPGEPGGSTTPH